MNGAHGALSVDREHGGIAVETGHLRELLEHAAVHDAAGDEHRVRNRKLAREIPRGLGGAREILGALEHELDDLEPAALPAREQLLEEHGLVVAVRAPAAADGDEHDLAGVTRV